MRYIISQADHDGGLERHNGEDNPGETMEHYKRVPLSDRLGPLTSQSIALGDRVYETISDAIVEGRLAPGERVSDKELAEALGVSRTPVREALQRLSWAGLIEMSPSRYTRVTEVSEAMIANTIEYTGLQAGIALNLAIQRMGDVDLVDAVALLNLMIAASDADDRDELMVVSRMFVEHLTNHTGNRVFNKVMRESGRLIQRNLLQVRPLLGDRDFRGNCFRRMREAMLIGDADGAERAFRSLHGVGVEVPIAS